MSENAKNRLPWISAGVVGLVLTFIINFTDLIFKDSRFDCQYLVEEIRKDKTELEGTVKELRDENKSLREKLMHFENSQQDLPIPIWLKDTRGRYLTMNAECERQYFLPNGWTKEYAIGKTDKELYGDTYTETVDKWVKNDKRALMGKKVIISYETAIVQDQKYRVKVYKYPYYAGRTVIGTGGIAFALDE